MENNQGLPDSLGCLADDYDGNDLELQTLKDSIIHGTWMPMLFSTQSLIQPFSMLCRLEFICHVVTCATLKVVH